MAKSEFWIKDFEPIHDSVSHPYAWQHITNDFRLVVKESSGKWRPVIETSDDTKELYPLSDSPEGAKKIAITWMNSVGVH